MPEGDTIFRAATTLRKALEGALLVRFESAVPLVAAALARGAPVRGQRVTQVEARGKNLLIHLEDGRALHTHMRMSGSWHLYRTGEAWQRPAHQARAVLEVDRGFVAVCFNAPIVDLLSPAALRRSRLNDLGPDATTDEFAADEAVRRIAARPELPLGEALLVQGLLAGVGNVIKSEVMFIERLDPFAPVGTLPPAALEAAVSRSHALLVRNRNGGPRTTRESLDGGRVWVYGRSGKPCRVCGGAIRMRRQGLAGRSTYFCPVCQGSRGAAEGHALGALHRKR